MFTVQQRLCRGLTLTALVVSCGGGTDPSPPPPPSGGIGPEGGTVTSADGRVTLVIPANALSGSTAVGIVTETGAPLDPRAITGSAYRVTPTATQFAVPATLTLTYDPDLRPIGVAEADLRLHRLGTGTWTPDAASTIDAAAHTATASITAGGGYGVRWLEPVGPCNDPVYREFDFLLGNWNFEVPGAPGGSTNAITADANGCAVAEDFNTPTGLNGRSVSFYNPPIRCGIRRISTSSYQLSAISISYQLSAISYQLSAISYQLSVCLVPEQLAALGTADS